MQAIDTLLQSLRAKRLELEFSLISELAGNFSEDSVEEYFWLFSLLLVHFRQANAY